MFTTCSLCYLKLEDAAAPVRCQSLWNRNSGAMREEPSSISSTAKICTEMEQIWSQEGSGEFATDIDYSISTTFADYGCGG